MAVFYKSFTLICVLVIYYIYIRIEIQKCSFMKAILEVCAGCIESVYAAQKGGAYRVELCSGLDEGGITPSVGYIEEAMAVPNLKKQVLIRPRGGDFLYTEAERKVICRDIEMARRLGVDGVVIGALDADGNIDMSAMRDFMSAAEGLDVTFHRAFDMCSHPLAALEQIISLGCHRILTSGQASTAENGVPFLRKLVELAADRISIMPGCGVNASNAAFIIRETGANEIHASARGTLGSLMRFRHNGVEMGKSGVDEYARMATMEQKVRAIVDSLI